MKFIVLRVRKHKTPGIKRILSWVLVAAFMTAIFLFSGQTGIQSNNLSNSIVRFAEHYTSEFSDVHNYDTTSEIDYNYLLRKAVHFCEYFILALLIYAALACCGLAFKGCIILSFFLSGIYAFLDEYHQWFVTGRTSKWQDAVIDIGGAVLAVTMICFGKMVKNRQKA